jgi:hypothetical protein
VNKLFPLMQREWLQHRFGWSMLFLVPFVLALLLVTFGQMRIDAEDMAEAGDRLPLLLAMLPMVGGMLVMFMLAWLASLIIVTGLARRDVGDRSVEFWLSMPITHSASFAAPLIVHLLLVPAAALALGLAGGSVLALVSVVRLQGLGAWIDLPWSTLLPAVFAIGARALAGLPLATLWLLPLILLTVLVTARFGRWGWVILIAGVALGSQLLARIFGQPLLSDWLNALFRHAGQAMLAAPTRLKIDDGGDPLAGVAAIPAALAHDSTLALRDHASPLQISAVAVSVACFVLLLVWRQRAAGNVAGS